MSIIYKTKDTSNDFYTMDIKENITNLKNVCCGKTKQRLYFEASVK